jgi:predicted ATPase
MKIKNIKLEGHPGIGDLNLSFSDDLGAPFNTVVLAGVSGTGKTAVLEAIQRTLEGQLGGNFGTVTIEFTANENDLTRIAHTDNGPKTFGGPTNEFTLKHDSNHTSSWAAYSLIWNDPQHGQQKLDHVYMNNDGWQNVFRSFFNEANVNFDSNPVQYITGLSVDDPSVKRARSGSNLASEITQLLIDIRASDAEDLTRWVEDNPGLAPPESIKRKRMARFADAFHVMFPSKRFKEVRHVAGGHRVEFEEFGRITSIEKLSTGEKQIVFRAGFLLRNLSELSESIVLIDEPELSLHPDWQERISSFYISILGDENGNHPQIIISTHSPFIVHGAVGAKIIILEKDVQTGIILEMPSPIYPAIRGSEAIRAFNIDSFLNATTKPLLILTEGESDAILFRLAWQKLRPQKPMDFELRAALGMKNINITLNDREVFSKLGSRMLLGVFDFDSAYDQWNGVWNKSNIPSQTVEVNGLVKRHPTQKGWAMVLPIPAFRSGFASSTLAGKSILSSEFLFEDVDIPTSMLGYTQVALGHSLPYFRDAEKMNFANLASTFPPAKFSAFEPLLARWEDILAGRI